MLHRTPSAYDIPRLRRRTLSLFIAAQVLSGLAAGSVVSVGSQLAAELTGSEAWTGSVPSAWFSRPGGCQLTAQIPPGVWFCT